MPEKWDLQTLEMAEQTAALSLTLRTKGAFLGAEVKEKTNLEELFSGAWQELGAGNVQEALSCINKVLASVPDNEKAYYTRAVCYARQADWRNALSDYSSYLRLIQMTSGPAVANALYGRALCLAKLGKRILALNDLNECIRVGPDDEQVTEDAASFVPLAKVARLAMLSASPELAGKAAAAAAADAASKSSASAAAASSSSGTANDESVYEGDVWKVIVTDLEIGIAKAVLSGKTPLLLDHSTETAVDAYFLYAPATLIEAKKIVLDVRTAGVPIETAKEELRRHLVHALIYGHCLVIRCANSAPDFVGTYCSDDHFPRAIFQQPQWPNGKDIKPGDSAKCGPFARIFKPADAESFGHDGLVHVSKDFRCVVTSTFQPASFESFLKEQMPLEHLQACHIVDRGTVGGGGGGASAMLSAAQRMKGRTAEGELTADRTTLILQGRDEDRLAPTHAQQAPMD